jgi:probable selenium-dependent hydroxylase accessory protein YqeC
MILKQALRLAEPAYIALVGAGGKTTAMFRLARQLDTQVLVSTSTHLAVDQIALADQHIIIEGSYLPDDF